MVNFDWDDANSEHIARHQLEPYEVEEAFEDPDLLHSAAKNSDNEKRYAIIGSTESNRILFIVYTLRDDSIRPITAREASRVEKRRYRSG